jgi:glycerophosphoryl diester phosphodiesterase
MITRRVLTTSALAAAATPAFAARKASPLVIAHRGASGERPEHTAMAYRLAIAQGADFIEPDLVPTKDGHLVARHENEIGGTTDVAKRPEFAARKVTKIIDGDRITGWFTEDFTLAELKTLRARERLPALRPGSAAFDGREPIVTFQEVVDLAKAEGRRTGRTVGLYPEMKHPTYFAGLGLGMEQRLADALKANALNSKTAPVFVQCFEAAPLKRFGELSKARRVFLASKEGGPADRPNVKYADMLTPTGLKEVATFAEGVGAEWPYVIPIVDGKLGPATSLVADVHALKLAIHPWTVRAENAFLPAGLKVGTDPKGHGEVEALLRALWLSGVDGLFSDFPGIAASVRDGLVRLRKL